MTVEAINVAIPNFELEQKTGRKMNGVDPC